MNKDLENKIRENPDEYMKRNQEGKCYYIDTCRIKKQYGITEYCLDNKMDNCMYYQYQNRLEENKE